MSGARFSVDYAKRASNCKRCKQPLEKGSLRVAKITPNPFTSDGDGDMKAYFHAACIFDSFTRVRPGTNVIESAADGEEWSCLKEEDKKELLGKMKELEEFRANKGKPSPAKKRPKAAAAAASMDAFVTKTPTKSPSKEAARDVTPEPAGKSPASDKAAAASPDDSLAAFARLCHRMAKDSKYSRKTEILAGFIGRAEYSGDLYLLCKLLIPKADQRVYNVKEKALIKLFEEILGADGEAMTEHFNGCGEIADTLAEFFEEKGKPAKASTLSLHEVDDWLEALTAKTREDDQSKHFRRLLAKATAEDLRFVIRMVKKDLRINAGAKHIMDALDPNAYEAFQASRDLRSVVEKIEKRAAEAAASPGKLSRNLSIGCKLGTPVLPMLAEACRSVEFAMKRCPNGMYAEVKYDGERVQVHKSGDTFTYYSRSLKPVQPHKVQHFSTYIPQAFPKGGDLILDAEVLLIDRRTSKPLPFGTLGKNKKEGFAHANVCLFIFDCLMYQGQSLMRKTMAERRKLLEASMTEVPNRVHFSDKELVKHGDQGKLRAMIAKAIEEGLEGLVLKDLGSIYEPGKRHWLKVKKDYLNQGSMADTADLVVLGANFGTGSKGGILSVFLMGCRDEAGKWRTVTKVGNGHDDATLERINKAMKPKMTKIGRDADKLPTWLRCARANAPDFVVNDPTTAPVWEITGAEFTKSHCHTADGVSIRFPRVTRIRDDKDAEGATSLAELKKLYATSRETQNFTSIAKGAGDGEEDEEEELDVRLPGLGPSSLEAALVESDGEGPAPKSSTPPPSLRRTRSSSKKKEEKEEENAKTPVKKRMERSPSKKKPAKEEEEEDEKPIAKKRPERKAVTKAKTRKLKAPKDSFISDDSEEEEEEEFSSGESSDEEDWDSGASIASEDGWTSRKETRGTRASPRKTKKEACRYGAACYQRNPEHRKRFAHPNDAPAPRPKRKAAKADSDDEDEASAPAPKKAALKKDDSGAKLKRKAGSDEAEAAAPALKKEDSGASDSTAPLKRSRSSVRKVTEEAEAMDTTQAVQEEEEAEEPSPPPLRRVRSEAKEEATSAVAKKTASSAASLPPAPEDDGEKFFAGLKALVTGKDGAKIGRYIGYYGGEVVQEAEAANVHVGVARDSRCSSSLPQLRLAWITDSVRRQKRLPPDSYIL